MSYKQITPNISEIETGTPAIKIGDKYFVGGIGGDFIPQVEIKEKEVTLGQVNAEGKFQPLAFSGTEATNSGSPEAVEVYYGFNGVLPVPESGGESDGCDFYKCASVDKDAKTWTGYKAVLMYGVYTFEETVTDGLSYGEGYTPYVNNIYDRDVTIQVTKLWDGTSVYTGLVFDFPMDEMATSALTGQELTIASDVQAAEYNGKKCFYMFSSQGITFPSDDLSTDDYTIAISMARTHTDQLQTALGYGERGSTGSTALIGVNNGDELFFGGYGVEVYGESMTQGKWYHGAVTKAGTQLTLYLNGKSVATHAFTDALVQGIGYIGRNSSGDERFHGYLSDAKIWNRALTADEIMTVYQDASLPE